MCEVDGVLVAQILFVEVVRRLEGPFGFERFASFASIGKRNGLFDVDPAPFGASLDEEDKIFEAIGVSDEGVGLVEVEVGRFKGFGIEVDVLFFGGADGSASDVFSDR